MPTVKKKSAPRRRPPPFVVRESAIQGLGGFATRAIARGERIVEYVGERISHAEADARYDDASMARHHTFLFTLDERICIDGNVGGNDSRFINHSCAPNAYSCDDEGRIYIVAGKAIAEGEEILYDYAYTVEPTDTLDDLRRVYPCRCGAAKCRGTLADVTVTPPGSKKTTEKKKTAAKTKRA
jgi:SET domain-containing protein